jgi:flagellar FliL protein
MSEPVKEKEAKPKKGMGAALTLVLLILNLGGTGFVAYKSLKPPHTVMEAAAPVEHKDEAGIVVPLDAFVVNLNEPGSSRYLKATFEIELPGKAAVDELEHQKRGVRDEILRYLSGLTIEDTQGEPAKTKIQENITTRVNKVLGKAKVTRVFFTEFVIQ